MMKRTLLVTDIVAPPPITEVPINSSKLPRNQYEAPPPTLTLTQLTLVYIYTSSHHPFSLISPLLPTAIHQQFQQLQLSYQEVTQPL